MTFSVMYGLSNIYVTQAAVILNKFLEWSVASTLTQNKIKRLVKLVRGIAVSIYVIYLFLAFLLVPWHDDDIQTYPLINFVEYYLKIPRLINIIIVTVVTVCSSIVLLGFVLLAVYYCVQLIFQIYICQDFIENMSENYEINFSLKSNSRFQKEIEEKLLRLIKLHVVLRQ